MAKLASHAPLCYNKPINIVAPTVLQTPGGRTHLKWRCIMTTVPPPAQDGNPLEKRCTGPCGRMLSATPEFFRRDRGRLTSRCKACLSEQQKIRYHNDPEYREKVLTQQKDYRALPEVQAHTQAYKIAYYSQPENLEHKRTHDRAYHTTPEYRQHQRSYYRSHVKERRNHPVYREHRRAYEKSPKVRTHKWAYQHLPHVHEHTLHYFRNYREENRESLNFYSRVRRQKPEVREKNLIRMRNYEQRPEVKAQKLVRKHIRRARENAVTGTYTVAQIKDLLKHQRYRCYYCHKKFEKRKGKYVYHIDHTFPLSRMVGTAIPANDISYLVLACPPCNVSKGNKFPWEWHKGGRLL